MECTQLVVALPKPCAHLCSTASVCDCAHLFVCCLHSFGGVSASRKSASLFFSPSITTKYFSILLSAQFFYSQDLIILVFSVWILSVSSRLVRPCPANISLLASVSLVVFLFATLLFTSLVISLSIVLSFFFIVMTSFTLHASPEEYNYFVVRTHWFDCCDHPHTNIITIITIFINILNNL